MTISNRNTRLKSTLMAAAVIMGLALVNPVNAASQCKGLSNGACSANGACTWVQGYERKDGRTVASFCRAKAKSKAKAPARSATK